MKPMHITPVVVTSPSSHEWTVQTLQEFFPSWQVVDAFSAFVKENPNDVEAIKEWLTKQNIPFNCGEYRYGDHWSKEAINALLENGQKVFHAD